MALAMGEERHSIKQEKKEEARLTLLGGSLSIGEENVEIRNWK